MKKLVIVAVVAGLIGFVAGNAFWYLASPLWIDVVVEERASAAATAKALSTGNFVDADAAHSGKGVATIYESDTGERLLRLTEFEVTNGPDLEVWLVTAEAPAASADVTAGEWLSLGKLKGNIGDQNYDIPTDADLSKYRAVVIWCEQFGVLFSPAALRPAS